MLFIRLRMSHIKFKMYVFKLNYLNDDQQGDVNLMNEYNVPLRESQEDIMGDVETKIMPGVSIFNLSIIERVC